MGEAAALNKQDIDLEASLKKSSLESDGLAAYYEHASNEELWDILAKKYLSYHPSKEGLALIRKAYEVADGAHEGQVRKSGEPYIIHPLHVAIILAYLEMDKETIIAGILHDVVEDTVMTQSQLKEEFGEEVALLVDGVTKLGKLSYDADKIEVQAENLRKMFLAMAKDIRVIIIKLADRLHNMRTLQFMSAEKQREKARETMEIYAPIAQRLGIASIKVELEDLALKYMQPEAYYDLVQKIAVRRQVRDMYIEGLVRRVRSLIENAGIQAEIYGRAKHFFSIYKKMTNQDKSIDQIYDLFAIRIIVRDLKDCYAALGIIHDKYTPIPGRFKDYIAMPKPNMYQSLHTTVIGPSGTPFEVQIRTEEMHRTSEYGIAAHWKYKEGQNGGAIAGEEEKLSWLRQILEWQQDMSDNHEFMSLLKSDLDLFSDMVFCFTPNGDVKNLPNGSTPIDFAYSIHSAVGNRMIGAKVNGQLVPIDYVIKNGDRIEVMTSQNSRGPSRDWLNIVKSTQAKNKINQWFRKAYKEENIQHGKELLVNYAKAKGLEYGEIAKPAYQKKIQRKYGFSDWESVLAAVGRGGLKESQIINRLTQEYRREKQETISDAQIIEQHQEDTKNRGVPRKGSRNQSGIIVEGLSDVAVHFSKCCSPVPGDEIVGFITRGRGVSIHRTDCVNILKMPEWDKERLIEAEWQRNEEETPAGAAGYLAELTVYAANRIGLIVDISRVFTEREIDIHSMSTRKNKKDVVTTVISFEVKGTHQLQNLIEKLRLIDGVYEIKRTTG